MSGVTRNGEGENESAAGGGGSEDAAGLVRRISAGKSNGK